MSEIVLTEEQARVVMQAAERVNVRDPHGDVIAVIDPLDVAALRTYREHRQNPRKSIPAAKVREHMRALEAEWERTGGFDAAYAREFMARLRERDGL
jgi:hypothetical protein